MPQSTLTIEARIGVCNEMIAWAKRCGYREGIRHWESQLANAEASLARARAAEAEQDALRKVEA